MEQSNNFNNQGGGKGPKMPRFNMNWLYTIILIALIALFFSGGGDALGGSAAKEATYTEFKQYVDKGYVLSVVANKTENTLKIYINPKYTRDVYKMSAQNVGPNPYVKVQFGSVDEVDRYGNQMVKEKKIRSFSYDNKKDNDFWSLIISLAPLLLFFLFIYWMSGRMGSGMSNMGGGIVNYTSGTTVYTIEGNCSGKVKAREYTKKGSKPYNNISSIIGYASPKFSSVSGSSTGKTTTKKHTTTKKSKTTKKITTSKKAASKKATTAKSTTKKTATKKETTSSTTATTTTQSSTKATAKKTTTGQSESAPLTNLQIYASKYDLQIGDTVKLDYSVEPSNTNAVVGYFCDQDKLQA